MDDRTPAEVAKTKPPFKEWADVVQPKPVSDPPPEIAKSSLTVMRLPEELKPIPMPTGERSRPARPVATPPEPTCTEAARMVEPGRGQRDVLSHTPIANRTAVVDDHKDIYYYVLVARCVARKAPSSGTRPHPLQDMLHAHRQKYYPANPGCRSFIVMSVPGNRLREARRFMGWTMERAASRAEVSWNSIRRWEVDEVVPLPAFASWDWPTCTGVPCRGSTKTLPSTKSTRPIRCCRGPGPLGRKVALAL